MKTLFCNLLILVFFQHASAQLAGKTTTSDGQPLPYVNVMLLKSADSSLVKATSTNDQGLYTLEDISPGSYILRYSSIGYQTWHSPGFELGAGERFRDFGAQVMLENSKNLSEVVVRAEKPLFQQQAHGLVVNVESSVLTKGSSALEVLERSPGVFIDRRYNSIALNGKNGVLVMINGKVMRMPADQVVTMLSGMSANDIEKIELMTTPPARYDAEGSAGMINIQLKRVRNQGSFSITGGYGKGEKGAVSANLARNIGNTNISGSYSYSHDKSEMDWFSQATNYVPVLGGQTASGFLSVIKPIQNSHNFSAGFDTRLNPKLTVGSAVLFNYSHTNENIVNHAEYDVEPDRRYILDATINGASAWKNLIGSVFLEKKLRDGEQVNFDLDYLWYKNDKPSDVLSSFVDKNGTPPPTNDTLFSPRQRGYSNTAIQVGVAKFDYLKQLSASVKLETGFKGTFTRNASLSGIESLLNGAWIRRSTTTNDMIMKEGIGAAYASLNARLSPSVNLVAGARYEYSRTQMDDTQNKQWIADRKLGKIFPSIFLTWKLAERSELMVSYTKRISRPSYNDLASFVIYTDPTSVETGNPLLQPTITNNLKIGYNYSNYSFSLLFSRDDHPIARYQISSNVAGDLMVLSPHNLVYQDNVTFQTNLPFKLGNWLSMNYGFVGSWRQFELNYTAKPVEKSYFTYSANFSESFRLPGAFSLEISGWYNAAAYDGSKKVKGFGAINGGVKKELAKNQGTLQFSVIDIFKTMRIVSSYGTITEEAFNLKSRVPFSPESYKAQIFKLTYSRSFGNHNIGKAKPNNGSQEERDRIRN